mmetsp:Transcript_56708/g.90180  ORF Transcript_56708/g.90180 Transcript_56708/m.90180 type:complete len:208 (+) Transcript_56708:519-1142(+)
MLNDAASAPPNRSTRSDNLLTTLAITPISVWIAREGSSSLRSLTRPHRMFTAVAIVVTSSFSCCRPAAISDTELFSTSVPWCVSRSWTTLSNSATCCFSASIACSCAKTLFCNALNCLAIVASVSTFSAAAAASSATRFCTAEIEAAMASKREGKAAAAAVTTATPSSMRCCCICIITERLDTCCRCSSCCASNCFWSCCNSWICFC